MRGNKSAERLGSMLRYTDKEGAIKEIAKALDRSGGDVQGAADSLGIAKRTLFLWASEHEEVSNAIQKARKRRAKEALEES